MKSVAAGAGTAASRRHAVYCSYCQTELAMMRDFVEAKPATTGEVAADLWDALTSPGLWKFSRRYPAVSWYELKRSFSRRLFCEALQRLVPSITVGASFPAGRASGRNRCCRMEIWYRTSCLPTGGGHCTC